VRTARKGETWVSLAGDIEKADDLAHMDGFHYPSDVPAGVPIKVPYN
jgi:hypothetical protein